MAFEPILVSRKRRIAALHEALRKLKAYNGETVVAGKHPLHKAIVELEKCCLENPRKTSGQLHWLYVGQYTLWFALIWSSRPHVRSVKRREPNGRVPILRSERTWSSKRRPDLARYWAGELIVALEEQLKRERKACVDERDKNGNAVYDNEAV